MNTRLFQITEDDLAALETELPMILERCSQFVNDDPVFRKRWEEVKIIVSNVRWNYGPPHRVEVISSDEFGPDLPGDEWKNPK